MAHRSGELSDIPGQADEVERRRGQISRVFHKPGAGPADERKICRDLKITAADRDEALRWLQAARLVSHQRNEWERCEGVRLSFTDCNVPILEAALLSTRLIV